MLLHNRSNKMTLDDLLSYFNVQQPGDVTWVHRVNTGNDLAYYLSSSDTMMIEGDISYSPSGKIIMVHPLELESGLSYDDWIQAISESQKGAKLDFKDPAVVMECLEKLNSLGKYKMPVLLNANILQGPNGDKPKFKAHEFIYQCGRFYPDGMLSIDWTTNDPNTGFDSTDEKYTKDMVDQMLAQIEQVGGDITFPVRACFFTLSTPEFKRLLVRPGNTLTVWNSKTDSSRYLQEARNITDPDRTFYDFIDATGLPL